MSFLFLSELRGGAETKNNDELNTVAIYQYDERLHHLPLQRMTINQCVFTFISGGLSQTADDSIAGR